MPLYEYFCESCDQVFSAIQSMDTCRDPAACPVCGLSAPRVMLSAPRLNTMRAEVRKAHQVNERSAHAPRVSQGHRCGPGCSHHHSGESAKPQMKAQAGKRPWMLGH